MSVTEWVALIMALVAAGGLYLNYRKSKPDELASASAVISKMIGDVNSLRQRLEGVEDEAEECEDQLRDVRRELDMRLRDLTEAATRVAALEAAHPILALGAKIEQLTERTKWSLNKIRSEGIVISHPPDDGRFVFVNDAFAQALGRDADEIVAAGWRTLIHPDDLSSAREVEGHAWSEGGTIDNRYRHADGSYVRMRWHFTDYGHGAALSIVWFERRAKRRDSSQDIWDALSPDDQR